MNNQFCPQCGTQNTEDAPFCSHCGNTLAINQEAAASAEPITPPSPQSQSQAQVQPQPQYTAVREMNYPKAGTGSRFLAYIVDGLVGVLPLVPGLLFMGSRSLQAFGGIWLFAAGCWAIFYGFCKDGLAEGQSYGKKMNGLMVVCLATNQPCTKGKSILRALAFCIPYIGGIIEIVMVLATDKGRRLGDKFAGTQVIEVSQYRK